MQFHHTGCAIYLYLLAKDVMKLFHQDVATEIRSNDLFAPVRPLFMRFKFISQCSAERAAGQPHPQKL